MAQRICVVADVDRLILAHLGFRARRQLSQVNRHYRTVFQTETHQLREWQRRERIDQSICLPMYWIRLGDLEAVQTLMDPTVHSYYITNHLIQWGTAEIFQWYRSLHPHPNLSLENLVFALQNQRDAANLAHYIQTQFISSWTEHDLQQMISKVSLYSISGAEWLEKYLATIDYVPDWNQTHLGHLTIDSIPILLWLQRRGVNFVSRRYLFWDYAETLIGAEEQLGLDFSDQYENIYQYAMEQDQISVLAWLLQKGYSPPPPSLPPLNKWEKQALEHYFLARHRSIQGR